MDRSSVLYAVVALLGVLAVALAAATLPAVIRPEGEAGPQGPGNGDGGFVAPPPPESPGATVEAPFLTELLALLVFVAVLAGLWYLYHNSREVFGMAVGVAVLVASVFLVHRLLSAILSSGTPPSAPGFGNVTSIGGGEGGGPVATTDPSAPSVVVVLLVGVALAGAGLALTRWVRRREADAADEASPTDAAAVGRAAGRAADRLEDTADVDNEVYRAWAELTELLELPRSDAKTPGEFAAAAVEAGMAPGDVRELTRLFEDVRYGDHRPSSADERRALAVFRRIEETYARDER